MMNGMGSVMGGGMSAMMGWMMGLGLLGWVLVIALLVTILVALIRHLNRPDSTPGSLEPPSSRDRPGEMRH